MLKRFLPLKKIILVFEMANACKYHCHIVLVAIVDAFVVAHAASGLYNACYALVVGEFYAVAKGEERIRCHYRSFEVESEAHSLFDGLFQSVHTRSLTYARGV